MHPRGQRQHAPWQIRGRSARWPDSGGRRTTSRYTYLLAHGGTGLSTDFDLPTLLGYDSDHLIYGREVGKIGVAVDTIVDFHALFDGIPLDEVSTALTINAPGGVLMSTYYLVGEEHGIPGPNLTGTTQNDIPRSTLAQSEFSFPPEASVEHVAGTTEYCAQRVPGSTR